MAKATFNCDNFPFLNRKHLTDLKTKAIRSGAWFKVMQRIDRVLFDLTIRVVDNIRSSQLAKSILVITRKLENTMKGSFSIRLNEIGLSLAQKIGAIAQRLGNIYANCWVFDSSFVTFLAVMYINNVKISRR
jgi:hypothetical protein